MSECEEREDSCSVQETEKEKTGSHTHQGTPLLSGGTCLVISHSSTDVSSKSLRVGGKGQRSFQQATPTIFLISCQPYILYWYILFRDNFSSLSLSLSATISPSDLPSEELSDDYMMMNWRNLIKK